MRDKFSDPFLIPVDDIKLDIFNFRYYGQLKSQRDCIAAMVNDPNSGLYNIAKDIAENGLTPEPIVVSKNEDENWVVREGNRRITALKLLNKPSIIKDYPSSQKFQNLSKKHDDHIPTSVNCITCNDENTILDYLDRLHGGYYGGIGRRPWNPENKTYYDMHRGQPGQNALALKVKEIAVNAGVKLNEPYSITNLQRVLQNSGVQSKLKMAWDGQHITTSVKQDIIMKVLKEIVKETGQKKAREIYVADDQQELVDRILKDLDIRIEDNKTNSYVLNISEQESTKDGKTNAKTKTSDGSAPKKASWDRKRLINTRTTLLKIPEGPDNIKARNIYNELARKIDVREAPNAASVLLRILWELSIENYRTKYSLKKKNTFHQTVKSVASHMYQEGKIEQSYHDEIMRICGHEEFLSVKTLHMVVHSPTFNLDPKSICILWDNVNRFISQCWK